MSKSPLVLPKGFRFAGVAAGIKASGKPDVSLIVSDQRAVAVGVYTTNQVVAAPVVLSRTRTPSSTVRAVITNSGNANACTGEQGMSDAKAMCEQVAERIGCDESDVLVMSTGVIGQALPMAKVSAGIDQASAKLAAGETAFLAAADAITTTDKGRKMETREITLDGETIRIAAMAKGAGMIAPNMATMLSVICTDATIDPDEAQGMLTRTANVSFNRVSVDGHTSTNDTLLLLANGNGTPLSGESICLFERELTELAIHLAKQLVIDGEGASRVMQLHVFGAEDDDAAEKIAKTVAASPLVKTAIAGCDPNWGRIVSAAGYAGEAIDPEKMSLKIAGEAIYRNGTPLPFDAAAIGDRMKSNREVEIELGVGEGNGKVTYWSSDLTTDYVQFNTKYTT
ncbi:Arginine biosynthesis bifunctional protein ArgJ [Novipirellula aureliae]|uniref:Arginine biosynthesis bifunctional protein ArgJ n=1 Tax=Novipirellula aureliae TaxID=2527966 RepID=A0A5C6DZM3_9BACT|nr:bifunctional glutamate N-acetyltransferase/amino-acid acetyltransferase ArgJ [Novipirellula aureliae]TWU41227.1 Arginine biosynthesis bifunctional protein ArgJ [Novipirellula aureliae]